MKRILACLLTMLILSSCGGASSDDPTPDPIVLLPAKAVLIVPANNELCAQGVVLSASQNVVTLKWNSAAGAESYDVIVKNLENGDVSAKTVSTNQAEVTLLRNTPYEWSVVSKSTKTAETAKSDAWRFYNAGAGMVNYAPFPAELIAPYTEQNVSAVNGKITLSWRGSDVDNDIIGYSVYLGTTLNPPIYKSNVANMSLSEITVSSNATYYWKVATFDSKGNSSESEIFNFKTN
jgi:hypothetical protein